MAGTGLDWTCSKDGSGKDSYKNIGEETGRNRRKGRPRLRWLEDVEKDLWEMKVKNWKQKAADREAWASVIKGAKAVRGQESQGVSGWMSE